jgi:hypothetical protein
MVKRVLILVLGALAITLLMATLAVAATPEDIYNDLIDGKLDGSYTPEELQAYQDDSTYAEYPLPSQPTDPVEDTVERDTFPFTGFQLMMAGIVAVVLVGGGLTLRRVSRSRQS